MEVTDSVDQRKVMPVPIAIVTMMVHAAELPSSGFGDQVSLKAGEQGGAENSRFGRKYV